MTALPSHKAPLPSSAPTFAPLPVSERRSDLASVVAASEAWTARGVPFVLATVVRVDGSSYRRPGARLLLGPDGETFGGVSGGCLERDLRHKAAWRLGDQPAVSVVYDRRDSEDGDGDGWLAGCQGRVEILLERQPDSRLQRGASALAFAGDCLRHEREGVLVSVFRSTHRALPVGLHLAWRQGGWWGPCDGTPARARQALEAAAREALTSLRSGQIQGETDGRAWQALVEVIRPPPHLFLFGGGDDAVPVVAAARALGWRVSVHLSHKSWEAQARFAGAHELSSGGLRAAAAHCAELRRGAAVLMSHDYARDRETLGDLLELGASYIGALGPARRTARMLADLRAAGHSFRPGAEANLHAPVGLSLGAETPEEIALAIVAEAQAVFTGTRGGFARDAGPLHAPAPAWQAADWRARSTERADAEGAR